MLALRTGVDHEMKRSIKYLCLIAVFGTALAATAADQPADSAQAAAKLTEIRGRIAALTNRLHDELKERDARSARLREAEIGIAAMRRRLENLRSALVAAERRRAQLRAEE